MRRIFENKFYPAIIYVCVLVLLVFITFSIAGIVEKSKANRSFTGFAINNLSNMNNVNGSTKEIYSEKAYSYFYLIIIVIGLTAIILLAYIAFPLIKDYT